MRHKMLYHEESIIDECKITFILDGITIGTLCQVVVVIVWCD